MHAANDHELLRRFWAEGSEAAFNEIVSRYVKLVYSAALRQVRDPHAAHDVTQSVFVLLARKAKSVPQTTILSGWLYRATGYVAADAVRAETRRRKREEAAVEQFSSANEPSVWHEIQPALDDAMRDLGKQEREFVLLRYFENRSLREVGEVMGVSEDAAQKRVSRALDRLRDMLAHRGAKISATALGSALANYSCTAAPTAAIVVTSVTTSAIGVSALSKLAIDFMALTKIKAAAIVVAAAAVLSAPVITQQQTIRELRVENQRLAAALAGANDTAPEREAADPTQVSLEEVQQLRAQVTALSKGQGRPVPVRNAPYASGPATPIDEETARDPQKRMYFADQLVKEGKLGEALDHYLWCYDNGAKSAGFTGVRGSFLLARIKDLSAQFPEAREALAQRRDALETAIIADQASKDGFDSMRLNDLIRLNDSLDEPNRNLALFDQLPQTHPARAELVAQASEQFIRANRYLDIVTAGNPERTLDQALHANSIWKNSGFATNEANEALSRRRIVQNAGFSIEALAGAGEVDRARAMIDKILKFDHSDETRAELLKYAERAGNGAVVEHIRAAK